MKITHVKVCNYRNLRNIDIGLAETVAIIGENNSGIISNLGGYQVLTTIAKKWVTSGSY